MIRLLQARGVGPEDYWKELGTWSAAASAVSSTGMSPESKARDKDKSRSVDGDDDPKSASNRRRRKRVDVTWNRANDELLRDCGVSLRDSIYMQYALA